MSTAAQEQNKEDKVEINGEPRMDKVTAKSGAYAKALRVFISVTRDLRWWLMERRVLW